jgi:hypothetical protein
MLVHGELDWIVMKALEKDRTRRYETASKFAEDVQHYLNDEAVEVGRLPIDHLTVSLARVTEHNTQDMSSTTFSILIDDWRASAKIYLSLLARCNLDSTKWQWCGLLELVTESPDAVIFCREAVLLDQVLKDPLSRQPLIQLCFNHFLKGSTDTPRPGRRFGWFWIASVWLGPGERFGWF